jgi:hypothetical protein
LGTDQINSNWTFLALVFVTQRNQTNYFDRMTIFEKINLWEAIFNGLSFVAATLAAYLAFRIGKKQNEINAQALAITNFVEIFLMPMQTVVTDVVDANKKEIKWNVLIKNVSSYPIYLNDFTLNGIKHDIGNSAIPNNSDSWYGIPLTEETLKRTEFSLLVSFEDYLGRKYQTEGFGVFDGMMWQIKSKKRIEIC